MYRSRSSEQLSTASHAPSRLLRITTPDWQAAVRRRTQFYLLIAFLLAVLFGVLVFQFFMQQQAAQP